MRGVLVAAGLVACLFLLAGAPALSAQAFPGTHRGLWVGMYNGPTAANHILVLDAQNTPTSFTTQPAGPWPCWGNPFGACMHSDNRHVVVPANLDTSGSLIGLVLWDTSTNRMTSTLWSAYTWASPFQNWSEWTTNSDGELVTIDNLATPVPVAHLFHPTFKTWRSFPLPATTRTGAGLPFLTFNRLDGKYYWGALGAPTEIYVSSDDFQTTQVLATGSVRESVGRYGGGIVENNDIYIATCCTRQYYVVKAGTSTLAAGPAAAGNVNYDLTVEHLAKAGKGLWGAIWNAPRGIQYIDLDTNPPTVTPLFYGSAATMPTDPLEVVELFTNDLNTVRTGNRTWDVNINPGQGWYAGKSYVLAISLTGASPITLPGSLGRQIFLTPDHATVLSVNGQLAPFLTNNVGVLDGSGRATARLDLTLLGTGVNGSVIHMAVIVLDPNGPGGFGYVCQPWAFVIKNR